MATKFRPHAAHHDAPAYNTIATSHLCYPAFPTSLHNDDSGYDAPGYEPAKDHYSMDPQTSPIQQHDLKNRSVAQELQHTQTSPGIVVFNGTPAGQFDMLPPPTSTHASWQALHDYAQSHAAEHGYALSINTTAKNRSRIKLACVCYGQPKNTHKLTAETRIRKNRVSYKTGCRMWVEGKKQKDGTWLLRVGEAQHNHPGRSSEGWAVQRKRTWGVVGGRIGVGGVTAKEELARISSTDKAPTEDDYGNGDEDNNEDYGVLDHSSQKSGHSLERGGLVWKIVEQEMLRKGESNQGRDRGVGRTVDVLKVRLPGIHIFKRDVYNIRAQIKRARKAAGQEVGDGVNSSDDETQTKEQEETVDDDEDNTEETSAKSSSPHHLDSKRQPPSSHTLIRDFALDPSLSTRDTTNLTMANYMPSHQILSASSAEVEQLRKEVGQLKTMLGEKTKEVMEKDIVIAGLRTQLEYMTSMAMLPS